MSHSVIESIGTAVPPFRIAQSDIFNFMSEAHGLNPLEKGRLKKLYSSSGIEYRNSVLEDYSKPVGEYLFYGNEPGLEPFPSTQKRAQFFNYHAIDLCVKAVEECFSKVPLIELSSITHLITITCTGLHAPGIDIELVGRLGLNSDIERTCINFMGCYAAFNALKTADYIIKSNVKHRVLIVGVELCTLHFQKENNLTNWLSNALFSDGAGAVLVSNDAQKIKQKNQLRILGFYSRLLLESKKEMAWSIGNFGFEMNLGSGVSKRIKASIKGFAETLLKRFDLSLDQIDHFAIHPGGRRILEVCEEELEFTGGENHPSYETLKNYGNMSSVTILFVLKNFLEKMDSGKLEYGKIMSFAFGPGLTFESMVLTNQ